MRARLLGLAGVAVAAGATGWAFAGGAGAPVVTLVLIGVVLALGDAAVWRAAGDGSDLDIPAGQRLPPQPWGVLVAVTAAIGLVAIVIVRANPAAVLVGIVGAAAVIGSFPRHAGRTLASGTVRTARRLRAFVRAHGVEEGQQAQGYLTSLGKPGARLLVVAPDGAWTDVMLGDDALEIAALARIELREPDDPLVAQRIRIGARSWTRMTDSW